MKKNLLALLFAASLTATLFSGCGSKQEVDHVPIDSTVTEENMETVTTTPEANSDQPIINEEPTAEPTLEPTKVPVLTGESNITKEPATSDETTVVPTEVPEITEKLEPTKAVTPTEAPAPTEEPKPTEAPEPTETVTPTEALKPTAIVAPTAKATATPVPTQTVKPTVAPTEAPKPTALPTKEQTKAPNPTVTPMPTKASDPTATPKPTATQKPTATPTPTKAPAHTHNYNNFNLVVEPTCYKVGTAEETCSCGDVRVIEVAKIDCVYETSTSEATCMEEGRIKTYCITCGTITKDETIPEVDHIESGWTIVTEATCTSDGLKHTVCTVCSTEVSTEIIPAGENHTYEWETNGDTRTHVCNGCGTRGITEYRYGDAWGYFDSTEASTLWYWINEQRKATWHGLVDDWGNPAGGKNGEPLISDSSLSAKAQNRAVEAAINFDHGSNTDECLAWGYGSGRAAYEGWCYSRSHARAMVNREYIYGGVAFFWYDGNDSGENLTPIAVLELGY